MNLKEYLTEVYDYNYWANKRYLAVAETLNEEQLFRKQGHSWDSVHAVFVHMMSSERMWPQRWRGEKGEFLNPGDFPTVASIRAYWLDVEKNMRALIAEQTEETLVRNVTYTNPRNWLPGYRPMDGQMALTELVKRYLYAYGPATAGQFSQWLAVPQRWAIELFDSLSAELQQVDLAGIQTWVVAGDLEAPSLLPNSVHLLPYFDAYVVGCHPRERVFPGQAAERALTRGQAGNYPVLLVDGIVSGVWSQRRSGRKLDLTVEPLKKLTADQSRQLEAQVQRIGEILEGNPRMTIGAVTTGGHA